MGNTQRGASQQPRIAVQQHLRPRKPSIANQWPDQVLKRLIQQKKLMPFYPPKEEQEHDTDEECPICMMYFQCGLNRCERCKQFICSECYLQVKKGGPKDADSACPFCQNSPFAITFSGVRSIAERKKEQLEQQKVMELKIKMQREEEAEAARAAAAAISSPAAVMPAPGDSIEPSAPVLSPTTSSSDGSTTPRQDWIAQYVPEQLLRRIKEGDGDEVLSIEDVMLREALQQSIRHSSTDNAASSSSSSSVSSVRYQPGVTRASAAFARREDAGGSSSASNDNMISRIATALNRQSNSLDNTERFLSFSSWLDSSPVVGPELRGSDASEGSSSSSSVAAAAVVREMLPVLPLSINETRQQLQVRRDSGNLVVTPRGMNEADGVARATEELDEDLQIALALSLSLASS